MHFGDFSPLATDGEIAAINLESARHRAWERFEQDVRLPGAAEAVIDHERLVLQFLGDLGALDRLDTLAAQLARSDDSGRSALVQAVVASTAHRFDDARRHLAQAARLGAAPDKIERQLLAIDQACGVDRDAVLVARREIAWGHSSIDDLVPLGAVLGDLEHFAEADVVYRQALFSYQGISPFPPAWVCFQLGMLWGEFVPEPDTDRAALWYRRAIAYLPGYVKASVHLAEIEGREGRLAEAEKVLRRVLSSGDPEVRWRLADVLMAQGMLDEADAQLCAARLGFDRLLERQYLAFADHAAEFYAGSGNDKRRALDLARANAANRPTRRALDQKRAIEAALAQTIVAAPG